MDAIVPYVELARLDRPVGIPIIVFPYLYGFYFALLTTELPISETSRLHHSRLPLLLSASFILRALGCAWNDVVDADIDGRVRRTQSRPIAKGTISITQACAFTATLWGSWTMVIIPMIDQPQRFTIYSVPLVAMVTLYPFIKRVSNYAQVFLGFTLGWGVLFGAAMADFDILGRIFSAWNRTTTSSLDPRTKGVLSLFFAYVVWTVIYDTVYAFQDIADDRKIGVNSMALRLEESAKPVLALLSLLKIALVAFAGKCMVHHISHTSGHSKSTFQFWPYYGFAAFTSGLVHLIMLLRVDLKSPKSCGRWFKMLSIIVGFSMALGLIIQYALL